MHHPGVRRRRLGVASCKPPSSSVVETLDVLPTRAERHAAAAAEQTKRPSFAGGGFSRQLSPQVTLYRATDGALCGFGGLGVVGRNGPTSSTTITGTDAEGSDCAREVSVVLYIVLYIALLHRVLLHIVILYCILHCFILYSVRGGAELRWALSLPVGYFIAHPIPAPRVGTTLR